MAVLLHALPPVLTLTWTHSLPDIRLFLIETLVSHAKF